MIELGLRRSQMPRALCCRPGGVFYLVVGRWVESFARLAQNAQREYEEVMRLAKYDEEIRDLKVRCRVHAVDARRL